MLLYYQEVKRAVKVLALLPSLWTAEAVILKGRGASHAVYHQLSQKAALTTS